MRYMDDIENLVGPPVQVTEDILEGCLEKGRFGALVYELYKEAIRLCVISSSAYIENTEDTIKLKRNQAICAGLLVRISKYMASVAKLSAGVEHGETVQALNRCILESAVNLQYLILKDDDQIYDRFVRNGPRAERELYDIIQENVESRGGNILAIEQGMIVSIVETVEQSGVKVEDIKSKAGDWGGGVRNRFEAIGLDWRAYTSLARVPSHAIHGDWVDLLKNHLRPRGNGFEPIPDHSQTDGELLSPVGILVIKAVQKYLEKYFDHRDVQLLRKRLDSLQERLVRVESSRPDWQVVE